MLRNVTESSVAVVPHHEVRRAILGIVIGNGIVVLIGALIVDVKTKIDIRPAVAVIVGNSRPGERSLWSIGKLKRAWFLEKLAAALVQKQKRAARAHDDRILPPIIVEVGKQRACCVVEDSQAGRFGDVLEASISAVSIKAIGQTRGLANVEIVEAIVVDVGD